MKRSLICLSLLAVSMGAACTQNSPNDNTAPKNGVVETNANVNQNMNANTAPSNVGVVTNNNGNQNTAGVRSTNTNLNANRKTGNGNN